MNKLLNLTVNGEAYSVPCAPDRTLLTFLREDLHLTGTKEGCGAGECGACTIIYNGAATNACMIMALEAEGADIRTIEGEADAGKLSALQQSFLDHGAVQCGFCTPGMVMSARALLDKNPNPNKDEIVHALEGNLCRCTGYEAIIQAVEAVAGGDLK